MLRLAPRLFTALGLRISQAARLLAAPISGWRGWQRPRRRRSIRPGLEFLEDRELLSSTPGLPDSPTLLGELAQLRNDLSASAIALVNSSSQPSPNPSMPTNLESSCLPSRGLTSEPGS